MSINFDGLNQEVKNKIYISLGNELIYSCRTQNITTVNNILENVEGIVNYKNNNGDTPLLNTCRFENPSQEIVKILLTCEDIDLNICDNFCQRAFYIVCINNHLEIANLIYDRGRNTIDINKQNGNYGNTALFSSVHKGHYSIVKFLLEKGADANIICTDETALSIACKQKHFQIVKELLKVPGIICKVTFNYMDYIPFNFQEQYDANTKVQYRFQENIIEVLKEHIIKDINFLPVPYDIVKYMLEYL